MRYVLEKNLNLSFSLSSLFAALALVMTYFSPSLFATGLSKSVLIGPKAIGMGGAFVAIADDPTAVFHNPAGMVKSERLSLFVGADSLITDLDYTPTGGSTESAKREFLPVPNFSITGKLAEPLYFGLGVFFPHGNGGKFSDPSALPTNPDEGRIYSMEIIPSLAVQLPNGLSFGAGLRVVRVSSQVEGQLFPVDAGAGIFDTIEDLDVSGWGLGLNAGVLLHPIKEFSWGLNYRSRVNLDLDGDLETASGGPIEMGFGSNQLDATLEQTLPTVIHTGFGFYPTDKLTLGISYQYEVNSEIDALRASIADTTDIELPQNWRNSHTFHFGAEYWLKDSFALRSGYAKDIDASIPDAVNNRITGDIGAHEVSFGAAFRKEKFNVGLTWNGRFGNREVAANGLNAAPGKYEAFVHSISLGVGYVL